MGDDRSTLVAQHMEQVRGIATRIHRDVGAHVEYDDLFSFGVAGLLEAASRFDPNRGNTFAAFAYYRIRGAIYDGLRAMGTLPPTIYRSTLAAQRVDEYLEQSSARASHERRPGARASSSQSAGHVRDLANTLRSVTTIYVTAFATNELDHKGIPDTRVLLTDELMARRQLNEQLWHAIERLPERERHMVQRCYFDGEPIGKAGSEIGLSPSWASRLHSRAVELLRDLLDRDPD